MNRLVAAFLMAAAGWSVGATTAAATLTFQGKMTLESATSGCPGGITTEVEPVELLEVMYQPADVGDNGRSTALAVTLNDLLVSSWVVRGQLGPEPLAASVRSATVLPNLLLQFDKYAANVRLLSQSPQTVTGQTKLIVAEFQMDNFANTASCSVNIIGVLVAL